MPLNHILIVVLLQFIRGRLPGIIRGNTDINGNTPGFVILEIGTFPCRDDFQNIWIDTLIPLPDFFLLLLL